MLLSTTTSKLEPPIIANSGHSCAKSPPWPLAIATMTSVAYLMTNGVTSSDADTTSDNIAMLTINLFNPVAYRKIRAISFITPLSEYSSCVTPSRIYRLTKAHIVALQYTT